MTTWWLVMIGGVLGSSHCVGMCGGLAAMIGLNTGSFSANLRAQLMYSCGRLTTYTALGAVAGFAGRWLIANVPGIVNISALLCALSGILLIREGLLATGLWQRTLGGPSSTSCLLIPIFRGILQVPGARNAFLGGILTGLLPCGLVYAFVSLAATSGDLLEGMGIMAAFGLGTVPLMVVTGCGASLLTLAARQRVWQIAGWSVVATGLLTVGRGVAFLQTDTSSEQPVQCPFCSPLTTDNSSSPRIAAHD